MKKPKDKEFRFLHKLAVYEKAEQLAEALDLDASDILRAGVNAAVRDWPAVSQINYRATTRE